MSSISTSYTTSITCYDYVSTQNKLAFMLCLTSYSISYILIYFTFNRRYLYVLIELSRWGWAGYRSRWGWAGWGLVGWEFTLVRQLPSITAIHH